MEEKYLKINDKTLFIKQKGKGEPMIFLHGGPGGSLDYFLPQMESLAKDFRIILYDQTGCGKSDVNEGHLYSIDDEISNLEELRKAFNLEKVTLFGESWGSILGLAYAARYPERIDKLILTAAVGLSSEDYRAFKQSLTRKLGFHKKVLLGWYSFTSLFSDNASTKLEQLLDPYYVCSPDTLRKKKEILYNKDALTYIGKELDQNYNLLTSLTELRSLPILIAQGSHDILTPEYLKQHVMHHLPNATLSEVKESGHWTILEQPEQIVAVTRSFMRSESVRSTGTGPLAQ
ncbi:alpha/beta hydrolase [Rossellomorea sp. SC111]|uniref:alpha/beta fold hydrolase n=1 Tax=Rossellomorea sp. SC111 TaxID=2968985 RepID=UPI00215AD547|nr:alpha/beta hydrolase [Rossellomorea sp. SC111]MCR8847915.1 alpha/beta hydrolase [Rossellomorea sp. SC111]